VTRRFIRSAGVAVPDPAHPALAVVIDQDTALRLFPGTPAEVFEVAAQGGALSFGAAYTAAARYWRQRAEEAKSARFSVAHRAAWARRREAAAAVALARLKTVIEAELAGLDEPGQGAGKRCVSARRNA